MKSDWSRLRAGGTMFGSFVSTSSTVSVEVLGLAGFDYLIIDLEHGMSSERDALAQLQAMEHTPALPCVRVESHTQLRASRLLDFGARAIMFPRVDTADQARACVAMMRYAPDGTRGLAVNIRASQFGSRFAEYRADQGLLTLLQIETPEAVANVDEIAAVDGADVLFVGPMDLTNSLGIFRQYDHPSFVSALERTVAACRRHGRVAGILLPAASACRRYLDLGFRFLTCGTDIAFLQSAARQAVETLRQA